MGNTASNTDYENEFKKIQKIFNQRNVGKFTNKYDEYETRDYKKEIQKIYEDSNEYMNQKILTVLLIGYYDYYNIYTERIFLRASAYFIENAKDKYNNKYMLNAFLWYDINHEIHLDKYNINLYYLHTTNVHLMEDDEIDHDNGKQKKKFIYVNKQLLFTLYKRSMTLEDMGVSSHGVSSSESISVIEIMDNTVTCNLTRNMNKELYDKSIGKDGIKPNAKTSYIYDSNIDGTAIKNDTYILSNGWFKIYFENSIIEQLEIIPTYKEKGNIESEKRNFTKQEYLKMRRGKCNKIKK